MEAELRELALQGDADARKGVELSLLSLRLRPSARGGPRLRWVQACEDRLSTGCDHRARHQSVADVRRRAGRYTGSRKTPTSPRWGMRERAGSPEKHHR